MLSFKPSVEKTPSRHLQDFYSQWSFSISTWICRLWSATYIYMPASKWVSFLNSLFWVILIFPCGTRNKFEKAEIIKKRGLLLKYVEKQGLFSYWNWLPPVDTVEHDSGMVQETARNNCDKGCDRVSQGDREETSVPPGKAREDFLEKGFVKWCAYTPMTEIAHYTDNGGLMQAVLQALKSQLGYWICHHLWQDALYWLSLSVLICGVRTHHSCSMFHFLIGSLGKF